MDVRKSCSQINSIFCWIKVSDDNSLLVWLQRVWMNNIIPSFRCDWAPNMHMEGVYFVSSYCQWTSSPDVKLVLMQGPIESFNPMVFFKDVVLSKASLAFLMGAEAHIHWLSGEVERKAFRLFWNILNYNSTMLFFIIGCNITLAWGLRIEPWDIGRRI